MGDPKAFLNIPRQEAGYRPVSERITECSQVEQTLNTNSRKFTGITVHGLRSTFLPLGLSNRQQTTGMAGRFIQRKMERSV